MKFEIPEFEAPEMKIVYFDANDIVTASGCSGDGPANLSTTVSFNDLSGQ